MTRTAAAEVSVVIPTFNRPTLLAETVRAVLCQNVQPREIIVVDNGTSDDTRALVQSQFGDRVLYLRTPPEGVQAARNAGIAEAAGKWVATLDDDDLWEPNFLQEAMPAMSDGRADLIYSDHRKFQLRDGEVVRQPLTNFETAPAKVWTGIPRPVAGSSWSFVGRFPAERILLFNPFYPSTMIARRDLVRRIGGFDPAVRGMKTEDIEFLVRMLLQAKLAITWLPLVKYQIHGSNESGGDLTAQAISRWQVFERIAATGAYGDHALAAALRENLPRRRVKLFDRLWRAGRFDVTRKLTPMLRPEDWTLERRLKWLVQEAPAPVGSLAMELRPMLPRNRQQQPQLTDRP